MCYAVEDTEEKGAVAQDLIMDPELAEKITSK
jgi:hypothetical protein